MIPATPIPSRLTNACNLAQNFWRLLHPFWLEKSHRLQAWGLLLLVLALGAGTIYLVKWNNTWFGTAYNALQEFNFPAFKKSMIDFVWLAITFVLVGVHYTYFQQMLIIVWRRWLTRALLNQWLTEQNFYRLQLTDRDSTNPVDNPDQRIADDVNQFVTYTLTLFLDTLRDIGILVTFIGLLWTLSGALRFTLGGHEISIPGYMMWAALLYAMAGTVLVFWIGHPLVRLNFLQQRYEADFRFGLIRLRENAESAALYKGEARENNILQERFSAVVDNFWRLMRRNKRLGFFRSGYGLISGIVPLVVAAPRYFAKEIKLGELMQIVNGFDRVQSALSSIIDSFTTWASWKAVVDRLSTFQQGLDAVAKLPRIPAQRVGETMQVALTQITKPDGTVLANNIHWTLQAGDRLLIQGPSGCGKSTLLRALAGIWPYATGTLSYPAQGEVLFLSQKPYLPLGTLREALYYPQSVPISDKAGLNDLLALTGLSHLAARLDEQDMWSHILSVGEQQRVALLRALLNRPKVLFMDEATSALDDPAEARLLDELVARLPDSIFVSIAHGDKMPHFYNKTQEIAWVTQR